AGEQHRDPTHVRRAIYRFANAQRLGQGDPEYGKAVGHSDAEVNTESRRRYQPAIEFRSRDNAFLIQKSGHVAVPPRYLFSPALLAPRGARSAGESYRKPSAVHTRASSLNSVLT